VNCLSSLEYLRPCALILLKTWRYISRLLTYLLTYARYLVSGSLVPVPSQLLLLLYTVSCFRGEQTRLFIFVYHIVS